MRKVMCIVIKISHLVCMLLQENGDFKKVGPLLSSPLPSSFLLSPSLLFSPSPPLLSFLSPFSLTPSSSPLLPLSFLSPFSLPPSSSPCGSSPFPVPTCPCGSRSPGCKSC